MFQSILQNYFFIFQAQQFIQWGSGQCICFKSRTSHVQIYFGQNSFLAMCSQSTDILPDPTECLLLLIWKMETKHSLSTVLVPLPISIFQVLTEYSQFLIAHDTYLILTAISTYIHVSSVLTISPSCEFNTNNLSFIANSIRIFYLIAFVSVVS